MRIVSADLTGVTVPFKPELGTVVTAGLTMSGVSHILVELHTDEGLVGIGEGVPRPSVYGESREGMRDAIANLLLPKVFGADPHDVEAIWSRWARVIGNHAAKAAVDTALHDLVGKRAGVPLYRLLGGARDGVIDLTMPIAMGSVEEIVRQATEAVAGGYRGIKVKVGKDLALDRAVTAAVREAIGADVLFYVDANCGYSRAEARRALEMLAANEVDLLEEPIAAGDHPGRARLAALGLVPLLLDESTNEFERLLPAIAEGVAGALSIRGPRSGFTLTRKILGLAAAGNVPGLVGSHRELGVGTAANAHLAAAFGEITYPAELGAHPFLEHPLLANPLRIEDGRMHLPDGPGLGVELDRAAVATYTDWTQHVE